MRISFKTELKLNNIEPTPLVKMLSVVGVNLGIKALATLSTGETFPNPQPYRKSQVRLAKLQKAASRKIKGSKNRTKANIKVAKLSSRTANILKTIQTVKLSGYAHLSITISASQEY